MRNLYTHFAESATIRHRTRAGSAIVVMISILLLAAAVLLAYNLSKSKSANPGTLPVVLSQPALRAIHSLKTPVEIRFYSILDPATVDPALPPFAMRAERLLEAYKDASQGKLSVVILDSRSDSNSEAAAADGIRAFNLQTGDVSFLGMTIRSGAHKEILPQLSPDFEQALEADITRAILRAVEASSFVSQSQAPAAIEPAVMESVKVAIPDYASISLDAGVRKLRETMLQELVKQGQEAQAAVEKAQAALARARQGGTQAEQDAARKALSEAEHQNADRIQETISRSTAQIRALEKLKSTTQ